MQKSVLSGQVYSLEVTLNLSSRQVAVEEHIMRMDIAVADID